MSHAFHVMAKPIGPKCNLDCTYCYYLEKEALYPGERRFRMPPDILETFIRDYIASQSSIGQKEIWFAWQGGEPTLLGLDYFRTIVALQRKHCPPGRTIANALQTNGTLLDEDWAQFLGQERFLVGLSLDGPPHLHDHYRRDRRDLPSSARVLNAWELLNRHKVETNILCVVNKHNAACPLDVYRYLRELGVDFIQFIPLVERVDPKGHLAPPPHPGDEGNMVTPWSVTPEDYGRFLCSIFDEWVRHDVGKIFVQLFDLQLGVWMGQPASLCVFAETCGTGLALEHNGDLYACDHYVYPQYRLGNIKDTPIADLAALPQQLQFGLDKRSGLPGMCKECRWRFACHGGCPKHRFLPAIGDETERVNYFCRSNRTFFEHAAPYFGMMAELLRRGQPPARIMDLLDSLAVRPDM
ncbi:anaerobic sulfatase maturase [Rhizobium petrolearium]|nr:anaerobic sulfatase maturase [Neorhizobium petrolearium]